MASIVDLRPSAPDRPVPQPRCAPRPTRPSRGRLLSATGVLFAAAALVVWRTGPGKVPSVEGWETFARTWPMFPLKPTEAYVTREALGQALYHALGWAGTGHFLALHLAALAVSAVVLLGWLVGHLGVERGVIAACIVLVAPITSVLLEWIGIYDSFSVVAWVALLLALRGRPWLQFVVGVVGGLQNFEQFAVSVVLLALVPELLRPHGLKVRVVPLAVGAVAGRAVLEVYLSARGAVPGSRATFFTDEAMQHLLVTSFAALAPVIIWSALGPLWLPALRALSESWGDWSRSLRLRVLAVGLVVAIMGAVTADHTRVMALVTFPLIVVLAMSFARREQGLRCWLRRYDTWLLLAVPAVVVWKAEVLPLGLDLTTWGL